MFKMLAEQSKEKNKIGELFGYVMLASLHSVNVNIGFDKKQQEELIQELKVQDKKG